jgi:hypothetical protein
LSTAPEDEPTHWQQVWFVIMAFSITKELISVFLFFQSNNIDLGSSSADYFVFPRSYRGEAGPNYRRFCNSVPERGEPTFSEYSSRVHVSSSVILR